MKYIKLFEEFEIEDNHIKDVELLYLNVADKDGKFYPTDCIKLDELNSKLIPGYFNNTKVFDAFNFNIRRDILYCEILINNTKYGRMLTTYLKDFEMVFRPSGSKSTYKKNNKDFVGSFSIEKIVALTKEKDWLTEPMKYYEKINK